ncbi:hypothetical protein DK389_04090 [Methylobacterium durans]|uniref:DUF551 domain-containing protein n=2 Tax=Methylobacterium durans TaxID=2202825 RepID=A0A2U8W3L5_9HYPH|nr:hypothetical protein DK389_04090 [Methylobacterium durans]
MERAPRDGRRIIAINRNDPDRRAVIRWDPERFGDAHPWHVFSCEQGHADETFTDWMPFPDCPPSDAEPKPLVAKF